MGFAAVASGSVSQVFELESDAEGDVGAGVIARRSCSGAAATGCAGAPALAMPCYASWRDCFSDDEFSGAVSYVVSKAMVASGASCKPHPTDVTGGVVVTSESSLTTGVTGGAAAKPTNATGRFGAISCIGGCADFSPRGSNAYVVVLTCNACGIQAKKVAAL